MIIGDWSAYLKILKKGERLLKRGGKWRLGAKYRENTLVTLGTMWNLFSILDPKASLTFFAMKDTKTLLKPYEHPTLYQRQHNVESTL